MIFISIAKKNWDSNCSENGVCPLTHYIKCTYLAKINKNALHIITNIVIINNTTYDRKINVKSVVVYKKIARGVMMEKKKRYNLGILIGGVHTYFPKEHIKGIAEAAKELDANVCFFLGTRTKDFFEDILGGDQKNSYDYQFNTIHDYSLIGGLDGLIVNYGTLGLQLKEVDPDEFARKYNGIPTVFLTEIVDVPNCHSLICDNHLGIQLIMEHLIEEHHLSRILFVAGPEHNTDAMERKNAYLEMMNKYGFSVTKKMIAQGDYSEFVDKQVECLLDDNPDAQAIVFANDEMAFAGYRVCGKRGLQVGKDIMITGFDDCERASGMEPPLTTIQQDGELMGKMAVEDLIRRLDGIDSGQKAVSRRVPVSLVVRESCGCESENYEEKETPVSLCAQVHRLNKTIAKMKLELIGFQRKSWFIPVLARDLNECMENEQAFLVEIMEKMEELHARSTHLFLLDEPIVYDGKRKWTCPYNLRLAASYQDGEIKAIPAYDRPLVMRENGICQLIGDDKQRQFMLFLLFSGEKQYGLLACDIEQEEFPFFYVISLQIGLSLHYLEISKEEAARRLEMSKDMEAIRERNRVLGIISEYDELTGLLNLRGFMDRARKVCRGGNGQRAYMIYGDLDHLKEINDTWGHPEGNFALQSVAAILKGCLRSNDILGRVGGDEYIIMLECEERDFGEKFRQRVKTACNLFNEKSGKPFLVEISLGIAEFRPNISTDIQQVISLADRQLYEAKKYRKKSVRREEK